MNYAEKLRDTYFENKEFVTKQRRAQNLSYVLTLEDKLKDGYEAYKQFCQVIGVAPKKITDFLRTEIT